MNEASVRDNVIMDRCYCANYYVSQADKTEHSLLDEDKLTKVLPI